jgi:hypothetical protein
LLFAFAAASISVLPAAPSFASAPWTLIGVDIDGEAAGDRSGGSVSLSADGSRVAIGAPRNDGAGSNAGHVRIYGFNGSAWVRVGDDIDGEAAGDESGRSVSLSADGSRVAIGALRNDGNGTDAGHVRVYSFNGSAWVQVGPPINGEAAGDNSGIVSLSRDGSRVAIGAPFADRNVVSNDNAGHVRIYDFNGTAWVQVGLDIDGENVGDEAGRPSLSADGSRVAIGTELNDGAGSNAGHVRIYGFNGSAWVRVGDDIDGEAAGDESGRSVSLSADGSRVAIGAAFNDGAGSNAGHVRIYGFNGSAWVRVGDDIDGEAADDRSGGSVSLSADGSRVAIGAELNGGAGSNAGHVRIYGFNGSAWVRVGDDIDGEAAGDFSGRSVSLSADGSRVAIGTEFNGGAGRDAGHVRVYSSTAPNVSPVFSSGTAGSGVAGVASSVYTAVASDADNDTVTYTLGSAVAGFTIHSSTGVVSMGAGVVAGSYVLSVVASDGTASVTQVVTVTVSAAPNVSPVFTSGLTGSGVAGVASSVYTAVASDANGDTVTYLLGSAVAGFTIHSSTGVVSMGAGVVAGSYVLSVVASDGTASATQVVTVTVSPAAVLARTGSDISGLSTGALALLILGLVAVAFTRRQERGNGLLIS